MAVTIQQLLNEIPPEEIKFQLVNHTLMEVDRGSKNKPASIKIGVPEDVAMNFMGIGGKTDIGMLILIGKESFERAKKANGL
jgi:hypothetical protein